MGIDQDAPIKERTKDMIIAICDDCIDIDSLSCFCRIYNIFEELWHD